MLPCYVCSVLLKIGRLVRRSKCVMKRGKRWDENKNEGHQTLFEWNLQNKAKFDVRGGVSGDQRSRSDTQVRLKMLRSCSWSKVDFKAIKNDNYALVKKMRQILKWWKFVTIWEWTLSFCGVCLRSILVVSNMWHSLIGCPPLGDTLRCKRQRTISQPFAYYFIHVAVSPAYGPTVFWTTAEDS